MAKWYADPTEVPAAPARQEGAWQYSYARMPTGKWQVKRKWEGAVPRDIPWQQAPAWSWNVRTLPRSWSPGASQFPFQVSQGITSDPQRQASFELGLGGARPQSVARKAYGTFFDPQTGFDRPKTSYLPQIRDRGGYGGGNYGRTGSGSRTGGGAPAFRAPSQATTGGFPWMSQGAWNIKNRMTRGVRNLMRR